MTDLPAPLVPPECDCTDLDGFMLNVERLMASELVALSSHEVVAAALFLWARSWKQVPAASLPDDERVMAAFARLPLPRFRKLKGEVLRGFVKCSDGRLYHRFLAREAVNAFQRKAAFQVKRGRDAERLRNWRTSRGETAGETRTDTSDETSSETRFVREGQGQGQGHIPEPNGSGASPPPPVDKAEAERQLFERGKVVLGKAAGGMITKLLKAKQGNVALARAAIEQASQKADPAEFVGAIIRGPVGAPNPGESRWAL